MNRDSDHRGQEKSWRDAIDNAFENADHLDEQSTIITGLLLFDAIRNTYPQLGVDEVIAHLSEALLCSIKLKKLLDSGLVTKFVGSDGLIRYKATQNH
jgi:hypothetical protein